MRIASFNVENLFERAKAFNDNTAEAREAVKLEADVNLLFEKPVYSATDKTKILDKLEKLGLLNSDEGKYAILRKNKGQLLKRPRTGAVTVIAEGRGDWVGWVALKKAPTNDVAIMNTGRVLAEVNADIIAVIEAENRVALKQFSDYVIQKVNGLPYAHVMLVDGNDERGIDVGIMTRVGYSIGLMRSHIHDLDDDLKPVYSRDCPEYAITTPAGEMIWVLPNHFKSKFGGNDDRSKKKRLAQSTKTAKIYNDLIAAGYQNVIVLGDLNDTPDSVELAPILANTDLKDVSLHPSFSTGEYAGKGTFDAGRDNQKIDYILLSPALFDRVQNAGIFRKGAWPGVRPKKWEVYPQLEKEIHAASDHHLIWCDIL